VRRGGMWEVGMCALFFAACRCAVSEYLKRVGKICIYIYYSCRIQIREISRCFHFSRGLFGSRNFITFSNKWTGFGIFCIWKQNCCRK
jgi:hypothetical protein